MFKNRAMQVTMVKKTDGEPMSTAHDSTADTVALATAATKDIMHEALKLVAVYITMDTARKVLLALVSK